MANRVNTIGTSLTLAVNQRLLVITSVHSYLEAENMRKEDIRIADPEVITEIDYFITQIYNGISGIRNIAIAPDEVMEYVCPYENNKSVL